MTDTIENLAKSYQNAKTMNGIALTRLPEIGRVPDALEMVSVETVRPKAHEVAIKLRASSMHIDEIFAAQGTALGRFYGPKEASKQQPYILGSSVSGIVVAVGDKVKSFSVGDEVIAIPDEQMETGSWAEYRCVKEKLVMLKPKEYSHVETAAITMAACVAWGAIGFSKAKPGDRCLVVGASGSIGLMLTQYLKSMDCHVTAVCSGANTKLVHDNGADQAVDYTKINFAIEAVKTGIEYDRIFDCIGGRDIEADAFRVLKKTGVYETLVGPQRYIGERKLSLWTVTRIVSYVLMRMFTTLFNRPRYMFGEKFPRLCIDAAFEQAVRHKVKAPIDRIIPFDLAAVKEAIEHLTTHRARGRIVIDFTLP